MYLERRRAERYRVNLDIHWEGASAGQRKGTISDISTIGCFILTSPEVVATEPIKVGIQLPRGETVTLPGEAVYSTEEIGFALRFTGLGKREQQFLQRLIDYARGRPAR
jgi:hypothetical protein